MHGTLNQVGSSCCILVPRQTIQSTIQLTCSRDDDLAKQVDGMMMISAKQVDGTVKSVAASSRQLVRSAPHALLLPTSASGQASFYPPVQVGGV